MLSNRIITPEKNEVVATMDVHPGTTPFSTSPLKIITTEKMNAIAAAIAPSRQENLNNSME
jgi:hypothetical protein